MDDNNSPRSTAWCDGAHVEMDSVGRYGTCAACGALVVPKMDGTARKHLTVR